MHRLRCALGAVWPTSLGEKGGVHGGGGGVLPHQLMALLRLWLLRAPYLDSEGVLM